MTRAGHDIVFTNTLPRTKMAGTSGDRKAHQRENTHRMQRDVTRGRSEYKKKGRNTSDIWLPQQGMHIASVAASKHRSKVLQHELKKWRFQKYSSAVRSPITRSNQHRWISQSAHQHGYARKQESAAIKENEQQVTIDTAIDVPCIAHQFIRQHALLRNARVLPVLIGAINLRSAAGLKKKKKKKIVEYIRFNLMTKHYQALVLPHLGPDMLIIDNGVMHAFGTK